MSLLETVLIGALTMSLVPAASSQQDSPSPSNSTRAVLGEIGDSMSAKPPKNARVVLTAKRPPELVLEKKPDEPLPWKFESETGVLEVTPGKGDLCTKDKVQDFRLHLEFAVPHVPEHPWGNNGNSGVYIQRRYEVQILNSFGRELTKQDCGALYQQRLPDRNASRPTDEWQTYDIVFRASRWEGEKKSENARITVVHNGVVIHDDVELTNKTGAGRKEGPDADVIRLQEHGNAVRYRNFWILPLELE